MAVALNTLHKFLRIELPGVIEPALEDAVAKTVQEFFKRSEAWRYTVPTLLNWTTAADVSDPNRRHRHPNGHTGSTHRPG